MLTTRTEVLACSGNSVRVVRIYIHISVRVVSTCSQLGPNCEYVYANNLNGNVGMCLYVSVQVVSIWQPLGPMCKLVVAIWTELCSYANNSNRVVSICSQRGPSCLHMLTAWSELCACAYSLDGNVGMC